MAEMPIEIRFPSRCKACARQVVAGTKMLWEKGSGVRCFPSCDDCAQQDTQVSQEPAAVGFPKILETLRRVRSAKLRLAAIDANGAWTDVYRITMGTSASRYPGCPYIVDAADRAWMGRIHLDGRWEPSRRETTQDRMPTVERLLAELEADFAGTVARIGKECGACVMCSRELTDPRSLAMGYGPVCADSYGLPWGDVAAEPELEAPAVNPNDVMRPEDFE